MSLEGGVSPGESGRRGGGFRLPAGGELLCRGWVGLRDLGRGLSLRRDLDLDVLSRGCPKSFEKSSSSSLEEEGGGGAPFPDLLPYNLFLS